MRLDQSAPDAGNPLSVSLGTNAREVSIGKRPPGSSCSMANGNLRRLRGPENVTLADIAVGGDRCELGSP